MPTPSAARFATLTSVRIVAGTLVLQVRAACPTVPADPVSIRVQTPAGTTAAAVDFEIGADPASAAAVSPGTVWPSAGSEPTAVTASVELTRLVEGQILPARIPVTVTVACEHHGVTPMRLTGRAPRELRWLSAVDVGGATVWPRWTEKAGLLIRVWRHHVQVRAAAVRPTPGGTGQVAVEIAPPVRSTALATTRHRVQRRLSGVPVSIRPVGAGDQGGDQIVGVLRSGPLVLDASAVQALCPAAVDSAEWSLQVGTRSGQTAAAGWRPGLAPVSAVLGQPATDPVLVEAPPVLVEIGPVLVEIGPDQSNGVRVRVSRRRFEVRSASLEGDDVLRLEVDTFGIDSTGPAGECTLALAGTRQTSTPAQWESESVVTLTLRQVPPFGERPTWLMDGSYLVVLQTPDGSSYTAEVARCDRELFWARLTGSVLTVDADVGAGSRAVMRVSVTLAPEQLGEPSSGPPQDYRRSGTIRADLVYLVSFDGRSANDNTLALAAEIRRRRPELDLCWGVADHGIELPAGSRSVLVRTDAWWRVLAEARYVVTNCWLPPGFASRPGQQVLQAWHGTPYKTLGMDRMMADPPPGRDASLRRHSSMWDLLVTQNSYSAEIFRRAYGFVGETLTIGYPRNDRLVTGYSPEELDRVRAVLGVSASSTVVLYLPTFRDHDRTMFRELDFDALTAALGPDHVLLVRGHSNTLRRDRAVTTSGVVDVTMYPDVSRLYAVADVLITDYSSAMFDFALTGKPILYFVPDLERYTTELRGTYFDLAAQAPGPLLFNTEEVASAVGRALSGEVGPVYAERYARWRQTYLAAEDGHAAERAIDRLLALP